MKTASGILPVAADTKKICLAWRSPSVRDGNRFGIIGGMAKPGLNPKDNALVELDEETGYSGAIELHSAFVSRLKGFTYYSFIGVVPTAFPFAPQEEFAWENSFIEWHTFEEIQAMIQKKSPKFHKGLLQLFRESDSLIRSFTNK